MADDPKTLDEMRGEVAAVIAMIPEKAVVHVREGGADENLFATLAVSVQKLIAQRDEAGRACIKMSMEIGALRNAAQTVTCAYCGMVYPRGTPRHGDGSLAEHIKKCPEHPMRKLLTACDAIGPWMSAAQDDPKVCPEMKEAIGVFFENFNPEDV